MSPNRYCGNSSAPLEYRALVISSNRPSPLPLPSPLPSSVPFRLEGVEDGVVGICVEAYRGEQLCGRDCTTLAIVPEAREDWGEVDVAGWHNLVRGGSVKEVKEWVESEKGNGEAPKSAKTQFLRACFHSSSSSLDGIRMGWFGLAKAAREEELNFAMTLLTPVELEEDARKRAHQAGVHVANIPLLAINLPNSPISLPPNFQEAVSKAAGWLFAAVAKAMVRNESGEVGADALCGNWSDAIRPTESDALRTSTGDALSGMRETHAFEVLMRGLQTACADDMDGRRWVQDIVDEAVARIRLLVESLQAQQCGVIVAAVSSGAPDPVIIDTAHLAGVPTVLEDCGCTPSHSPHHLDGVAALVTHSTIARDRAALRFHAQNIPVCRAGSTAQNHPGLLSSIPIPHCIQQTPTSNVPLSIVAVNLGVDSNLWKKCPTTPPQHFPPLPPGTRRQQTKVLRLVYFGRISPEKGVGLLIRALKEIPRQVHLDIVGNGPLLDAEQQAARRTLGQNSNVTLRFLGSAEGDALYSYVCNAHVVIFPAYRPSSETLGLVGLEALAAGRPLISFATGGSIDYLNSPTHLPDAPILHLPVGWVIRNPGDRKSFAKVIEEIDFEEIEERGATGATMVQNAFTAKHAIHRFYSLWSCISSCPHNNRTDEQSFKLCNLHCATTPFQQRKP